MSKLKDAIYGLAVGDALGVPFEFNHRGTFHCKDMIGHGTWNQVAGTWSDDTSLTLATCDSIRVNKSINPEDIMLRFSKWLTNSQYTAHSHTFDVGMTTRQAIQRFLQGIPVNKCGGAKWEENGNGSLMRILPLAFIDGCSDNMIMRVSSLTHAHEFSVYYCIEYVNIAKKLLAGNSIKEALGDRYKYIKRLKRRKIQSGGFVEHTFYAALWCLVHTRNYKDCVLTAVNLGEDTDTTAAVAGGLAGIVYGYDSIPKKWIDKLQNKELIDTCIDWRF